MASAEKKFDLVVFGASGFTGQYVVEEIAKTVTEESSPSWAIAGRNMSRLQNVLKEASKQTGEDLENIPVLIADIQSEASIQEMCQQARIVLNCVGPYQLYGEPVVRACIEHKAHHIDISGEPVFLEKVQLLYQAKAKDAGVYILGSCGFDSIPAEMGVVFMQTQFEGDLNEIECYLSVDNGPEGMRGNSGTWNSAVMGYTHMGELKNIRKDLFPKPLPKAQHRIARRPTVFRADDNSGWCLPFVGADRSIVMRTQRYNYGERHERPVQYNQYMKVANRLAVAFLMLMGLIFGILVRFSFGRSLMEKYPKVFSLGMFAHGGPSRKQIAGTTFTLKMFGKGYSTKIEDPDQQHEDSLDKTITTTVSGPEMGYATTPICMLQAAYTLIKEQDKMPPGGGVFTPGAAFAKTSLIDRLNKHNVKFSVLEK